MEAVKTRQGEGGGGGGMTHHHKVGSTRDRRVRLEKVSQAVGHVQLSVPDHGSGRRRSPHYHLSADKISKERKGKERRVGVVGRREDRGGQFVTNYEDFSHLLNQRSVTGSPACVLSTENIKYSSHEQLTTRNKK